MTTLPAHLQARLAEKHPICPCGKPIERDRVEYARHRGGKVKRCGICAMLSDEERQKAMEARTTS